MDWCKRFKLLWAGAILLAGCQFASPHSSSAGTSAADNALAYMPNGQRWRSVEIAPSPRTPKISGCDKINPLWWFKNSDDPVPPDWFEPGQKGRGWSWLWRNPFHNFSHYVIGIADKKHVRTGQYPDQISNPAGGWNFTIAKYKLWRLPFVSYRRGKFEFYFGWRVRGNFGIKINFDPEHTHPLPAAR